MCTSHWKLRLGLEMMQQVSCVYNDSHRTNRQTKLYIFIQGLKRLGGYFNLSMSYRQDADILIPYGQVVKSNNLPNETHLDQLIQEFGQRNSHLASKENHSQALIAQFVSNCGSVSGREALVASLSQHVPVDVFGDCGKLKCPRSNSTNCYQMLGSRYKFYLSLENAVCKDYVTEKFFNILPYNTIPVVMNGADMANIAPKHSFINILDFASTAKLAAYLKKVAQDDVLFASYFWWRDFYKVKVVEINRSPQQFIILQSFPSTMVSSWCKLCSLLHSQDVPTHPPFSLITDLWQYWDNQGRCRKPPFIQL